MVLKWSIWWQATCAASFTAASSVLPSSLLPSSGTLVPLKRAFVFYFSSLRHTSWIQRDPSTFGVDWRTYINVVEMGENCSAARRSLCHNQVVYRLHCYTKINTNNDIGGTVQGGFWGSLQKKVCRPDCLGIFAVYGHHKIVTCLDIDRLVTRALHKHRNYDTIPL